MKKFFLLALIALSSAGAFAASGNQYVVNDQQVEQLFTNSVDASLSALSDQTVINATGGLAAQGAQFRSTDKTFVAAILLNFFLGGLGYILTFCGIFGIVPLVDFIVLIVHNDDISAYVDNTQFFMWAGNM
jgi:thiol:disulfide interchange protein